MAQPKNKLERLRKINFLSQKEVADLLGVSQQVYSKIENGKTQLNIETAKGLKRIYKLSCIDELLDEAS